MRWWPFAAALSAILLTSTPGAAGAESVVTSPGPERVAVTVYRNPERPAAQTPDLHWLGGYALITETRRVTIARWRQRDPLRGRGRRHRAAERDRHRLSRRRDRAQPRRLSAFAGQPARPVARPAGHDPPHLACHRPGARERGDHPQRRRRRRRAADRRRLRGVALHRPCRVPGLSTRSRRACRPGRPSRCAPDRARH